MNTACKLWLYSVLGLGLHSVRDVISGERTCRATHWNVLATRGRGGPGGVSVRGQRPRLLLLHIVLLLTGFIEVHAARQTWGGKGVRELLSNMKALQFSCWDIHSRKTRGTKSQRLCVHSQLQKNLKDVILCLWYKNVPEVDFFLGLAKLFHI